MAGCKMVGLRWHWLVRCNVCVWWTLFFKCGGKSQSCYFGCLSWKNSWRVRILFEKASQTTLLSISKLAGHLDKRQFNTGRKTRICRSYSLSNSTIWILLITRRAITASKVHHSDPAKSFLVPSNNSHILAILQVLFWIVHMCTLCTGIIRML